MPNKKESIRSKGRLKFNEVRSGDFLEEYEGNSLKLRGFFFVIRGHRSKGFEPECWECIRWSILKEDVDYDKHYLNKSDFQYRGYRIARHMPVGSREKMQFQAFNESL